MPRVWLQNVSKWNGKRYVTDFSRSIWIDNYAGPVALCKETAAEKQSRIALEQSQTAAAQNYYQKDLPWQRQMQEQAMATYNEQLKAQTEFQNRYLAQSQDQYKTQMQFMKDAYAQEQARVAPITAAMTPYLSGDVGYTADQMKALNNQGMTQLSTGYDDAYSQMRAALLRSGEGAGQPMSGVGNTNVAELQAGMANATAGMRNTNLLSSYNQALANKFNAAGAMMGTAQLAGQNFGVSTGGSEAALQGYGNMARGYAQTPFMPQVSTPQMLAPPKPPGFWSQLGSTLAGVGGQVAGAALGGGVAQGLGGFTSWLKRPGALPTNAYNPVTGSYG
jgi:hypothetical protein